MFLTASMYCVSGLKKDLIVVVVLVISHLTNLSVFNRLVYIQGGDMKFLFSRIHLEMKYVRENSILIHILGIFSDNKHH